MHSLKSTVNLAAGFLGLLKHDPSERNCVCVKNKFAAVSRFINQNRPSWVRIESSITSRYTVLSSALGRQTGSNSRLHLASHHIILWIYAALGPSKALLGVGELVSDVFT